MPTREKQLEYLFRACQDLFHKGLIKARTIGPERAGAFAAGFVYGRTVSLFNLIEQGGIEPELVEAYQAGWQIGQQSFEPAKWMLVPAIPHEDEPRDRASDVTIS